MKRKMILVGVVIVIVAVLTIITHKPKSESPEEIKSISAMVIDKTGDTITIQDANNVIYTFEFANANAEIGNTVVIEYTGILDDNAQIKEIKVLAEKEESDELTIPESWNDNGIFKQNYLLAYKKLKTMTLDEKIGQLIIARYSDDAVNNISKYPYSGFIFYAKDFENKNKDQVIKMIKELQDASKTPLLITVDEEGGSVVRISSNPKLSTEKFKSPGDLYDEGGLELIKQDTINKSKLLNELGINLNLAPVVDVTSDSNSYIYDRTLKQDTEITSLFAKAVINASKGTGVSYTLKHFPGYGDNADTHTSSSVDTKSLDEIKAIDLPPFVSGINVGAEAVLVSHNIVNAIDDVNPTSLSIKAHNLLRNDLGFTGIIITDDLAMGALEDVEQAAVKALLAGNDLLITKNYEDSFNEIKAAVTSGAISEELIDKEAFRVLSWKYYKNLIIESNK